MTKSINVLFNDRKVGKLALIKNNIIAFQYDEQWFDNKGFSLFPLSNSTKKLYVPKQLPFNGMLGVFYDSLPWGFGKFLVDIMIVKHKINRQELNYLTRLSFVGNKGLGALSYSPGFNFAMSENYLDFDKLSNECFKVLYDTKNCNSDELFLIGGTLGGSTPKITTTLGDEEWIIKFPKTVSDKNIGEVEYKYTQCAKDCGIKTTETILFDSEINNGYFCTKRFDRNNNKKVFTLSASALLEADPSEDVDYNTLMKLTLNLTKNYSDVENLFKLMCFNVFVENKNDNLKKFSFVFDENKSAWSLSPAYGLKPSICERRLRSTSVNGSQSPQKEDLLAVAKNIGMSNRKAKEYLKQTEEQTKILLSLDDI